LLTQIPDISAPITKEKKQGKTFQKLRFQLFNWDAQRRLGRFNSSGLQPKQPFVNGFPQLTAMKEGPLVDEMHDQEVKPRNLSKYVAVLWLKPLTICL